MISTSHCMISFLLCFPIFLFPSCIFALARYLAFENWNFTEEASGTVLVLHIHIMFCMTRGGKPGGFFLLLLFYLLNVR